MNDLRKQSHSKLLKFVSRRVDVLAASCTRVVHVPPVGPWWCEIELVNWLVKQETDGRRPSVSTVKLKITSSMATYHHLQCSQCRSITAPIDNLYSCLELVLQRLTMSEERLRASEKCPKDRLNTVLKLIEEIFPKKKKLRCLACILLLDYPPTLNVMWMFKLLSSSLERDF